MNSRLKYDFEDKVFKKLFSDCSYKDFTKEDIDIILNVLEREVRVIKNDIDLGYIKSSIECLKRDGEITLCNRYDLRQALYSIFR